MANSKKTATKKKTTTAKKSAVKKAPTKAATKTKAKDPIQAALETLTAQLKGTQRRRRKKVADEPKAIVPANDKTVTVEMLDTMDLSDLSKLPPTLTGPGFRIVNLNTPAAHLIIEGGNQAGRYLAATLYNWNSEVFPYHQYSRVVTHQMDAAMTLSGLISAEDFGDLERDSNALWKAITKTVGARMRYIQETITKNEPLAFTFLAEALVPYKGKNVVLRDGDRFFGAKLVSAELRESMWKGLHLAIQYHTHVWKDGKVETKLAKFDILATSEPKRLQDYGIDVLPTEERTKFLVDRGRRVLDVNERVAYIHLDTDIEVKELWRMKKIAARGRGIVDMAGLAMFDPNNRLSDEYESLHDDNGRAQAVDAADVTQDMLFSFDPYVMVFSFTAKKWGRTHISQVSDIVFRDNAFEKLVLPEDEKKLVYSLVKNADPNVVSDLIDSKGGGCTLLLHGEPGLGKTLTAEAVAETLRRPLYSVSVGELGTNPESLEKKLQTVLATAHRWNAVLLLDEADVFLESRTRGDIHRNAMVGTFLRLLEYYNGVLILTTNRVTDMDKAFYSRISLALRYPQFTTDIRKQVARNLMEINKVSMSESDLDVVANMQVNGRQIKNAIRLSRFIAKDENRDVTVADIVTILNKLGQFQIGMDDGSFEYETRPKTNGAAKAVSLVETSRGGTA